MKGNPSSLTDADEQTRQPLVSVLIPVFNREDFLGACIQSALDQTWHDLEVIVVDNASTDGTWEVCKDFASRESRVRIFRNASNLGPVRNWQRCMEEARGTYGKILFSDDLMAPAFLELALPWLKDDRVGFVFSAIVVGESPENVSEPHKWRRSSRCFSSSTVIRESLLGTKMPVSPGAALFRLTDMRKNLLLEIPTSGGTDFTRYGAGPDVLLYLLTAAAYPLVAYLAEPLTFFRNHPESITVRENGGMIESHYFQAKLWFSGQVSSKGVPICGNLRRQCLAHGWLLQRRNGSSESLADFCHRHGEPSSAASWWVITGIRLYRLKLRYQRSLWRFFDRVGFLLPSGRKNERQM